MNRFLIPRTLSKSSADDAVEGKDGKEGKEDGRVRKFFSKAIGFSSSKLQQQPQSDEESSVSHLESITDDSEEEEEDDLNEMMVIEISFGKGKSDEIVVHYSDDPHELAEEFIAKNKLPKSSVDRISKHIASTIEKFKTTQAELRPQSPTLGSPTEVILLMYADYSSEAAFVPVSHISEPLPRPPVDLPATAPRSSSHDSPKRISPLTEPSRMTDPRNSSQILTHETLHFKQLPSSRHLDGGSAADDLVSVTSTEERYNRIKDAWADGKDKRVSRTTPLSPSKVYVVHKQNIGRSVKSHKSTAHDRLHSFAVKKQKQLALMEAKQELERQQSLAPKQVTESAAATRLYEESKRLNDRAKKREKQAEAVQSIDKSWSCVQCGTFHELTWDQRRMGTSELQCTSCGVSSTITPTHRPINVALENDNSILQHRHRGDIFEFLYQNDDINRKKIAFLTENWSQLDKQHSFQPHIPESSRDILKKKAMDDASSAAPSVNDRLYASETLCRSMSADVKRPTSPVKSKKEVEEIVQRLTYEYKDKKEKIKSLEKKLLFEETGGQMFQPVIGPPPAGAPKTTKSEEFHEKLLRKGRELQSRTEQLRQGYLKKEKEEWQPQQSFLLKSNAILKASTAHNIEEMYKILLASQRNQHALDASSLTQSAQELSNWRDSKLDVKKIEPELMIESVQTILKEFKQNYLATHPDHTEIVFPDFEKELWQLINAGKKFIHLSKPTAPPTSRDDHEYTFRPSIDPVSDTLARRMGRGDKNRNIVEVLQAEGSRIQSKISETKKRIADEETEECTFQPKLFKPPKNVKPVYRGMRSVQSCEPNQNDTSDNTEAYITTCLHPSSPDADTSILESEIDNKLTVRHLEMSPDAWQVSRSGIENSPPRQPLFSSKITPSKASPSQNHHDAIPDTVLETARRYDALRGRENGHKRGGSLPVWVGSLSTGYMDQKNVCLDDDVPPPPPPPMHN